MARASWCGPEIYAAAAAFRERCLIGDGSLFAPGAELWTPERVRAVGERAGVGRAGTGSFAERLAVQLDGLEPTELQVGAELLYMVLLPEHDTHHAKKREHLDLILALLSVPVTLPRELDAALGAGGVAGFGAGKAHRDAGMRLLARLFMRLKETPVEERRATLGDPWALHALVGELRTSTDAMQANAFLHLMFPEQFEYMISDAHRQRLIRAFEAAPGVAEADGPDRRLARIRELASAGIDGTLDLYADPFQRVWSEDPPARWSEAVAWARRLYERDDFDASERTYKLEVAAGLAAARTALLAGERTWHKALLDALGDRRNNLVSWRARDAFVAWCDEHPAVIGGLLEDLWADGDAVARLHAFLERLPQEAARGAGTRLSIASLLLLALDATRFPFYKPTIHAAFRQLLGLDRDEPTALDAAGEVAYAGWTALLQELRLRMLAAGTPVRDQLDAQSLAWWLVAGAPPDDWEPAERAAFEAFRTGAAAAPPAPQAGSDAARPAAAALALPPIAPQLAARLHLPEPWLDRLLDLLAQKRQLILYGPPGTGKTFLAQHLGRHLQEHGGSYRLVQFHPSYTYEDFFEGYRPTRHDGGALSFDLVPGTLRELAREAQERPEVPHLLVIDEINRGNVAKVFGELYFLLEYRDASIRLQYSRHEDFRLPPNLLIVGTMNTADRSIALIDSALRRRFWFVGLDPTRQPVSGVLGAWLAANGLSPEPADLLDALNRAIEDAELAVGPSYFITGDASAPDVERIWEHAVMPLLEERYHGSGRDLEAELGLAAIRRRIEEAADPSAADGA